MSAIMNGFLLGISLIAAIGSQNAFVLRQSIKKSRPFLVAGVCATCDVILILIGAMGLGKLISAYETVLIAFFVLGTLFIGYYSMIALKSVFNSAVIELDDSVEQSGYAIILMALGFSLLNPHAWLDTTVLIGTVSASFTGIEKAHFTAGACLASLVWFFALSTSGTALSRYFKRPMTWKIINFLIFAVLLYIGSKLGMEVIYRLLDF